MGGFGAGQVGPGIKSLNDGRVAAAKMLRVIERKPEIDINDTENKKRLLSKTNKDNKNAHSVDGELVFENVHFKYLPKGAAIADGGDGTAPEGQGRLVFGGCNLTMKAGETVALGEFSLTTCTPVVYFMPCLIAVCANTHFASPIPFDPINNTQSITWYL